MPGPDRNAPDLQSIVDAIHAELSPRFGAGRLADYIPELARVDPRRFGLAVVDLDGRDYAAGDADVAFSIQSISKVFLLTLALGKHGETLWKHVGREPSGTAFNSIIQLELEQGRPRNPFINAGAIVVTDRVLAGHSPREAIGEILRFLRFLADDDDIIVDAEVARSEAATGARNYALAQFMRSFDRLTHPVDQLLGVYFHHCAIAMSCRQLARAGLFLAAGGRNPLTGHSVVSPARARRINALMLTCGHYDGSGDFAYHVGLPGKSGVGGGILAVAPGPRLDLRLVAGAQRDRQLAPRHRGARAPGPPHRLVGLRVVSAPLAQRTDDREQHHRADDGDDQRADEARRRQPEDAEEEGAEVCADHAHHQVLDQPVPALHHLVGDPAGDQSHDQKAQPAQSAHVLDPPCLPPLVPRNAPRVQRVTG